MTSPTLSDKYLFVKHTTDGSHFISVTVFPDDSPSMFSGTGEAIQWFKPNDGDVVKRFYSNLLAELPELRQWYRRAFDEGFHPMVEPEISNALSLGVPL